MELIEISSICKIGIHSVGVSSVPLQVARQYSTNEACARLTRTNSSGKCWGGQHIVQPVEVNKASVAFKPGSMPSVTGNSVYAINVYIPAYLDLSAPVSVCEYHCRMTRLHLQIQHAS
jgi:hypothetical protein